MKNSTTNEIIFFWKEYPNEMNKLEIILRFMIKMKDDYIKNVSRRWTID